MERPEDNAHRSEDGTLLDFGGERNGHQPTFSPESEHPDEPSTGAPDTVLPKNQWSVEVVSGHASDATGRMYQAIEILLNASAHLKQ